MSTTSPIKNKLGETLIEVIISLSAIMLAGAAAASIVLTALQTTVLSENYLVAQNLALEAVEIVKNTRDTNYMKYPLNIDDCWLTIGDGLGCTFLQQMEKDKNYRLDTTGITFEGANPQGPDGKLMPSDHPNYQLSQDPVTYIYTHDPSGTNPTKFYRGIKVTGGDLTAQIQFDVIVEWYEGAAKRRFLAEGITVTNFQ